MLIDSTVSGNTSNGGDGIKNTGTLTVTGSTISGNAGGALGGGILSSGTLTVNASTISGNSSSLDGGGIYISGGTVSLANTIVAGNAAPNGPEIYSTGPTVTDKGGNITSATGVSLAPLGNYGGPTQTMIPLPGSTAICAGTASNWNALSPSVDQRGVTTSDPNCATQVDSGAVQSDYSIGLSQDASNVMVNTAMSPAPAIQLDESGSAFTLASGTVTIPLTLTGAGTLTGGSVAIADATGIATYSDLQIDTASMSDKLTANLTLTSGIDPAVVLSVKTSSFEVMGGASSMTANAGTTPQTATVNTAFTNALGVTVLDSASDPVEGVSVTFTAPGSGASGKFSNSTTTITLTTNANGVATAPFTANTMAGANYTVTASAGGVTAVSFTLTNKAGAASSMTANSGTSPQTATVNTAFTNAPAVTVEDMYGNPVSGVSVTFTAPGSGVSGKFSNNTATITVSTNASGIASAPLTANSMAGGPYTVSATSAGLTTQNFSLTNTAGAASSMTANAGTTPQTATVNTAFANALAVTVEDASSNPVSGVSVTFTAPGSGASGKFSNNTATITVTTNSSGVASAPFTANSMAGGPYTVSAASAGLTTLNFSLSNTAGAASSMTANAGTTPQTATVGTAFGNALAVTVEDASSNPVSGVSVTFTAPGSGASGKFSNSTATITVSTNSSGVASAPFTANSMAGGPYSVSAASAGLTTQNFSLTNAAGAPSSMTANAGTTPQTAPVGTAFANSLAVTVKDASNNPVSGVSVTFAAPGTGASGTFSNSTATITATTNSSGVATARFTANGTAGGPYSVSASAAGLTAVNFSLTNAAGAASSMTANAGTTPQSALVNAVFANALAVTVKDSFSNPVSGVSVTFTAPSTGAGGTFGNSSNTIVAATNSSGVASAAFTANGTSGGPYTVSATAAGLTTANFSLTNTPATLSATCPATNSGTVNAAFNSGAETVTGGVQPYTFYVGSGSVPNGLTLDTSNGAVSGTPLTSGSFTIDVKDSRHTVSATGCGYTIVAPALSIVWPTPAAITYGTALSATQLDATANVSGSFTYNPGLGTVLSGGTDQLVATFTPTDTKDYSVTLVRVTIEVNKATPVISWSPEPIQIGSKLTSAQLDATANVPGKFVYTPALGTKITTSTQTLKVVFTPTVTKDYNSVTKTVPLQVNVAGVSPASVNFSTQKEDASSTATSLTLTNSGATPLTIDSIAIAGADPHDFEPTSHCPSSLAAGGTCTIDVTFKPAAKGSRSANLVITDNAGNSPQTATLSGTGD
jgi:Fe-S cluster assembly iron-binding protein IscA